MPKIGRNDPCPCGSGKKYKFCCRDKDEAAEHAAFAAARAAAAAKHQERQERFKERQTQLEHEDEDELARASNAVIDLVHAGRLDEAEPAARELLVRFPEVHDGYDRLGMVYEARGDRKAAAECYRKVIGFVRAHPELYDPDFEITFQRLIAKLDPSAAGD